MVAYSCEHFIQILYIHYNILSKFLPCSADTVRAMYIEFPSFQVSPEVDITLSTDSGIAYNGTLQVDYCSTDKALYNIYFAPEDTEEDE